MKEAGLIVGALCSLWHDLWFVEHVPDETPGSQRGKCQSAFRNSNRPPASISVVTTTIASA